jgi:hypothetical protein
MQVIASVTPVAPGTICSEHGCKTVHPAETHDSYLQRYEHSTNCETCQKVGARRDP